MRQQESRASLVLRAVPDAMNELSAATMAAAVECLPGMPTDTGVRVAVRNDRVDTTGSHLHRFMPFSSPIDVVVDVWRLGDRPPPTDLLAHVWHQVDRWACPHRSQALAGRQVRFIRGFGDLAMDFLLVRKRGMTHDGMIDHWMNQHTTLGYPRLSGYSQLHVDASTTERLSKEVGVHPAAVDGMTEPHYDDPEHFLATSVHPSVYRGAAEDELKFLDHPGCSFSVMSNFWLRRPASGKDEPDDAAEA